MSSEETEWKLLERRIKHSKELKEYKEKWDKEHNKPEDQTCPKCGVELKWAYDGRTMESEVWLCNKCNIEYEVDVELVRYWDTLRYRYDNAD